MNVRFRPVLLWIAGSMLYTLSLVSCNEPSLVGEDFVGDDVLDVRFSDTFRVLASPVRIKEITVFDRFSNIRSDQALVGTIEDDNFGRTEYAAYVQYRTQNPISVDPGFVVDSVILHMKYDTAFFFGDSTSSTHEIEVYRIIDELDQFGVYTSATELSVDPVPLGRKSNFNAITDKPFVFEELDGDTTLLDPQLRIELSNSLGQELLSLDSVELRTDSLLNRIFEGLYIESKAVSQEALAFEFTDQENSGITVFYRIPNDTATSGFERRIMEFITSDFKPVVQRVVREPEGSLEDQLFNDQNEFDSLVFLEGLNGPEIALEFENLNELSDVLVVKADLVITAARPNGLDYNIFPPVSVIRTRYEEDGELFPTDEYREAFASNGIPGLFGGFVSIEASDVGPDTISYTFNLSRTVQQIINGEIPNNLRLNCQPRLANARRTVIYGTTGKVPMELRITYTSNN